MIVTAGSEIVCSRPDGSRRNGHVTKYLMTYESTPEGLAKARAHFAAHRDRLNQFHARGSLLMAGPLLDTSGRALGVFTTREAAEEFIRDDPFVVHGVVARWTVVEWNEVLA